MRFHKTPLNLVVVDFKSLEQDILEDYKTDLKKIYNVFEEDLPTRDSNNLRLYYTLTWVTRVQNAFDNKRDVLFYVDDKQPNELRKHLITISKSYPVMVYHSSENFEVLKGKSGETTELINNLTEYRYSYEFVRRPGRKITDFSVKKGLKKSGPYII